MGEMLGGSEILLGTLSAESANQHGFASVLHRWPCKSELEMIRPATNDDLPAILELAVSSGLFPAEATAEVAQVFRDCLGGTLGPDHQWLVDDADGPVAVAYYAPERMTDGTWNLLMIAVHPDRQRQGRGAALVRHVENALTKRNARLLLVETSGLASFERTRAFYRQCGFDEEARIREYYNAGEDKIVFRKSLVG
jgi:ribosomal protein S18 acetylase RimI-like enzyme